MRKNVISCTLEQYNKKYRNRREYLAKFTKKQVEDFDKKYPTDSKNYLIQKGKWALIGDTYYEIPKAPRLTWFRNLNSAVQIGTCVLGAGVVAAAITVPIVLSNEYASYRVKAANILTAANATIKKVNVFGNALAGEMYDKSNPHMTNGNITYDQSDKLTYCDEQKFGFYIYNNIHYALQNFYGNGAVRSGTVITGETRRIPDPYLRVEFDDTTKNYPNTTLSAKVDTSTSNNKIYVEFQADWDFRSETMKKSDHKYMDSVILTNGRIIYNQTTKKPETLMINYYWTGSFRAFGTYTMDYLTDTFYFLDGAGLLGDTDINRWSYNKGGANSTINSIWNDGSLTPAKMRDFAHYSYEAFTGKIIDDHSQIEDIKEGYVRTNESGNDPEPAATEESKKWEEVVTTCYNVNKGLKLRTESDMLNLSNAKKVTMDNCPKYAESKTKLFWIYKDKGQGQTPRFEYTNKYVMPFREKEDLLKDIDKVSKDTKITANTDKSNLVTEFKNYLNNLKDSDYTGEVEGKTSDITFKYIYDKKDYASELKDYRFNCYKVLDYKYKLSKNNVDVKYYIDSTGNIVVVD